jgi:hypothetical protein
MLKITPVFRISVSGCSIGAIFAVNLQLEHSHWNDVSLLHVFHLDFLYRKSVKDIAVNGGQ